VSLRAGVLALLCGAGCAAAQEAALDASAAVLRGLDKLSGDTQDLTVPVGGSGSVFGLDVTVQSCRAPLDDPTGDAYAYLTVRANGEITPAFSGWMVASSPALNALDHSRYDVWVLRCVTE